MSVLKTVALGLVPRPGHKLKNVTFEYDDGTIIMLQGETLAVYENSNKMILAMAEAFAGGMGEDGPPRPSPRRSRTQPNITSEDIRNKNKG